VPEAAGGLLAAPNAELARRQLIRILQLAYSGERAAAYAYRGHWKSVRDPDERRRIREIEQEEWHHRELVGGLLSTLGAAPSRRRELRALIIGRVLGALCHVSGWFAPMYGAGRLERRNIFEYEDAARFALDSGHADFLECLLTMAEVEWEHERYFRSKVEGHSWSRTFRVWSAPPPKEQIRDRCPPRAGGPGLRSDALLRPRPEPAGAGSDKTVSQEAP
jgi:rubrerythrin